MRTPARYFRDGTTVLTVIDHYAALGDVAKLRAEAQRWDRRHIRWSPGMGGSSICAMRECATMLWHAAAGVEARLAGRIDEALSCEAKVDRMARLLGLMR